MAREAVFIIWMMNESVFFDGPDELVTKVKEFLNDDSTREKIRLAGYARATADHSLDARADIIINQLKSL